MKKILKKCLTCKHMDFVDDNLEVGHCFEIHTCDLNKTPRKKGVKIKNLDAVTECVLYKVNKKVLADTKLGCW